MQSFDLKGGFDSWVRQGLSPRLREALPACVTELEKSAAMQFVAGQLMEPEYLLVVERGVSFTQSNMQPMGRPITRGVVNRLVFRTIYQVHYPKGDDEFWLINVQATEPDDGVLQHGHIHACQFYSRREGQWKHIFDHVHHDHFDMVQKEDEYQDWPTPPDPLT